MNILTQNRLKELLEYNPKTGIFIWRVNRGRTAKIGTQAGTPTEKGYLAIEIDGRTYRAHRLAWLYMTGRWPASEIDHKNGIRNANWFDNLREATHGNNCYNRGSNRNNTSGFKGVVLHGSGKWQATIRVDRRRIHLGSFPTPEAASAVYEAKAAELFGEFKRNRPPGT
jgi:hypothetical protein